MTLKSKYIDNLLYKQREKVKYIYDIQDHNVSLWKQNEMITIAVVLISNSHKNEIWIKGFKDSNISFSTTTITTTTTAKKYITVA